MAPMEMTSLFSESDSFLFNVTFPPLIAEVFENDTQHDLVTVAEHFILLRCQFAVRTLICIGGMLGNVLNIRTFRRIGLEDSMTIAFFNLAISDFIILVTILTSTIGTLCQILQRDLNVHFFFDPFYVMIISVTFGRTFIFSTAMITTFLAIQRCLCVVRPLHFKGVFTRYRSRLVMVLIWVYCLICGLVFVAQYDIRQQWSADEKDHVLIVTLRPTRRYVLAYIQIANDLCLTIACIFFVFLCVVVMARVLIKSVQFRQANSNLKDVPSFKEEIGSQANNNVKEGASKGAINSRKERQVIVQVSIVSVIFLVSNIPALMMSLTSTIEPEFELYTRLHYTFWTCFEVRSTLECINSAVNFLVYYKYNSKFREACFRKKV